MTNNLRDLTPEERTKVDAAWQAYVAVLHGQTLDGWNAYQDTLKKLGVVGTPDGNKVAVTEGKS